LAKGDEAGFMEIFMIDKISPHPSFPKRGIGKTGLLQGVDTRASAETHSITHYTVFVARY
jgi:hypothetical protein